VSSQRCGFASAGKRQISKEQIHGAAGYFSEGIAVEKQEWGRTVTAKQQVEKVEQRQFFGPRFFPECADFLVSF